MTTACVGVHEGGEGREEGGDGRSMVRMYVCTPLYVRMYVPPPPLYFILFLCACVCFFLFFCTGARRLEDARVDVRLGAGGGGS